MIKLAIKSILGMLNLAVMMGIMLFLPARTFNYSLAWVYLAVFFLGVMIISVYIFIYDKKLLESRLKVGTVAERRISQKIIQTVATLGFIGMYLISGFDFHFHWSNEPIEWCIFADLLLALSMVFMFWVFKANSYLSAIVEIQGQQKVVSDGPYKIVRHPMYLAAILLFVSTPLALGSYWALITTPLMLIVLVFRCLDEEKMLREQLNGYKDYCHITKYRLIPFIW